MKPVAAILYETWRLAVQAREDETPKLWHQLTKREKEVWEEVAATVKELPSANG